MSGWVGQPTMIQTLAKLAAFRFAAPMVAAGLSLCLIGAGRYEQAIQPEHVQAPASVQTSDQADVAEPAAFKIKAETSSELLHDAAATPVAATPVSAIKAQKTRKIWMQVTAYCPCTRCCGAGAQGLTASGRRISFNHGRFVAADTHVLPFNTKLIVPGYAGDAAVQVIDRGGAIKGNHIDLFFPTHEQAREWGVKWMQVTVLE